MIIACHFILCMHATIVRVVRRLTTVAIRYTTHTLDETIALHLLLS